MAEITDITSAGMGVCRIEGMVAFVPYTIVGEDVQIEIVSKKKGYCTGKVISIRNKSPFRRSPLCPYYGKCGGCSLMHMDYAEQLRVKENIVKQAINRIGKTECEAEPILAAESETGYRNKAAFPVKDGKLGYYTAGSRNIVETDSCPLLCGRINQVLRALKPFVRKYGNGLTHVVVRSTNDHIMVSAVTDKPSYPHGEKLIAALGTVGADSININYNTNTKQILGKKTDNIFGMPTIPYTITGNTFEVSPTAFLQVNDVQAELLYKTAIAYVNPAGKTVIDAYCGTGTISLALARHAEKVTGIEINPASIENAKASAKKNGITNADFYCGKCEDIIPKLLKENPGNSVLVADPPRAGMEKSLVDAIAQAEIPELVYISCDPSTLARDIGRLCEHGYRLQSVIPVDMFPNTAHVETVVLLNR